MAHGMTKLLTLAAGAWFLASATALADPYTGEVRTFAFRFCPTGHAWMHGQLIALSSNTPLFSLLQNRYGGSAQGGTFALPAAKPIYTVTGPNLVQCMATQGVFPLRP
jgi:microcystin-dependent protein